MLRGEVEVFVRVDLRPDVLGVVREAVGGDAPVVFREEDGEVGVVDEEGAAFGVRVAFAEACAEFGDFGDEAVGLEDLVWEGDKGKVEVVFYFGRFETRGLGEGGPDAGEVS